MTSNIRDVIHLKYHDVNGAVEITLQALVEFLVETKGCQCSQFCYPKVFTLENDLLSLRSWFGVAFDLFN